MEYIYSVFVNHGVLPEEEIDQIKKVTGVEFIDELLKYHEKMKIHRFPFVQEKFFALVAVA